jgi:HEAT repeat protein
VWGIIAGSRRKPAPAPEPKLVERVCAGNRGRTVLDITLKIWAAFANDEKDSGRRVGYDYFIRQHADDTLRAGLAAIADKLSDLNWGFIPKADLKIPAPGDGKTTLADLAEKALGKGLLVEAGTDSVTFRHPLLAACLAGESLKDAPRERLTVLATHPGWRDAIAFAAPLMSIEPMVLTRLSATPDLLNQSQLEIAYWLQDSPTDAGWRGELFRRFSLMLGGPSQYPLIRERAAAALVTSRDKNVSFVFRQALKSADANVRRLGCIGLGSLGDPEIIKDVSPLLADPDPDVQLAAGLGLGALRSDVALEKMMEGLYSGEESLRRAVAETFAAIPDATSILRETVNHEDVQVRRASVFGLARIKAPWALAILYRVLTDDPQWYVRSAAEEAFRKAETTEGDGPIAHPDAADLTWLIAWAAGRGEGVPAGAAARSILVRALQEGDPLHRAASAMTIAYLGYTPGLKPLYNALRDKDEAVRGTAYEALGILQMRLGKPLPAVLN